MTVDRLKLHNSHNIVKEPKYENKGQKYSFGLLRGPPRDIAQ